MPSSFPRHLPQLLSTFILLAAQICQGHVHTSSLCSPQSNDRGPTRATRPALSQTQKDPTCSSTPAGFPPSLRHCGCQCYQSLYKVPRPHLGPGPWAIREEHGRPGPVPKHRAVRWLGALASGFSRRKEWPSATPAVTTQRPGRLLPQDAKADLAVAVEVGVKSHGVVARRHQFDPRRVDGVVRGTPEHEQEEAPFIGSVKGAGDQGMDLQNKSWFRTARGSLTLPGFQPCPAGSVPVQPQFASPRA